MIELAIKGIEIIIKLLIELKKDKQEIFSNFIKPLHSNMKQIVDDYLTKLTTAKINLTSNKKSIREVISEMEMARVEYRSLRIELSKLSTTLEAINWEQDSIIFKYVATCEQILKMHPSGDSEYLNPCPTLFSSFLHYMKQSELKNTPSHVVVKELESCIQEIETWWSQLTSEFLQIEFKYNIPSR